MGIVLGQVIVLVITLTWLEGERSMRVLQDIKVIPKILSIPTLTKDVLLPKAVAEDDLT